MVGFSISAAQTLLCIGSDSGTSTYLMQVRSKRPGLFSFVSVVQRCPRREIPREADELSLDAGHGRHGSWRIQGERGARVVGTYRSRRASDRIPGDDVIWVVMGKHHALDLAADKPGPEHRRCADAAKAQRSSVHPHG